MAPLGGEGHGGEAGPGWRTGAWDTALGLGLVPSCFSLALPLPFCVLVIVMLCL